MSYRVGYCPQTGEKIMVRDVDGRWNSRRKNYRKAVLTMANGQRIPIPLSETAINSPNLTTIINSITDANSEAGSKVILDHIKQLGVPVSIEEKGRK